MEGVNRILQMRHVNYVFAPYEFTVNFYILRITETILNTFSHEFAICIFAGEELELGEGLVDKH